MDHPLAIVFNPPVNSLIFTVRIVKFFLPILLIAAGVVGFVALKNGGIGGNLAVPADNAEAASAPVSNEVVWPVNVLRVAPQQQIPEIELFGRFETPREAVLRAAISADVVDVDVFDGSKVAAGTLLVRLSDSDAALTVAERQAELDEIAALIAAEKRAHQGNLEALERERQMMTLAKRAETRAAKLAENRVGSESVLDDARAQVETSSLAIASRSERIDSYEARIAQYTARQARADAALRKAQLDLARTEIRAPFNGRVTAVDVAPGERTRVGDALVTLYDVDFVELRAQIPDRYLQGIRQAMTAGDTITAVANIDGREIRLAFDRFAGQVERGRGGVDGLFRLRDGDFVPELGRTTALKLSLPSIDAVSAVPFSAIYGTNTVYKIDADKRLRSVRIERVGSTTGEDDRQWLLVRGEQLQPDDLIVVSQLPSAVDGLRVNPVMNDE